jgi:uncharacterized protein (DUF779 family)
MAGEALADEDAVPVVPGVGTERVTITPAAAELLTKLTDRHGPLMFHQSGGCCDGSSPMCYPAGDFKLGQADVHLGDLDVPGLEPIGFHMSRSQFEYWEAHPPHRRRGEGTRQRVLGRGARGRPVHDPLAALHRRRGTGAGRALGSTPSEGHPRPASARTGEGAPRASTPGERGPMTTPSTTLRALTGMPDARRRWPAPR